MKTPKGTVFNIQRYSIHDGPGIRTVVFLKGCLLRCAWCSNPESWRDEPQLFYERSKCIGCGRCADAAPSGCVRRTKDGIALDWLRCNTLSDLSWTAVCPTGALSIKGRRMSVDDVLHEVEKDRVFYEQSGGGVTLSGGEALKQHHFAWALLCECKRQGIRTALETCGFTEKDVLIKMAGVTDLFLYDIKLMDSRLHRKWTGRENERIIENLKILSGEGTDILVRTPLIPGVNDARDQISQIMDYLKTLGLTKYELLPFHQYGSGKYRSCGLTYTMADVQLLDGQRLESLQSWIRAQGFSTDC